MNDIKIPDYTPIRPDYRILSVTPVGNSGTKVKISYYDTKDFKFHEKLDDWKHITVSREIISKKHGYTPEKLLKALHKIYPAYEFTIHPYGSQSTYQSESNQSETELNSDALTSNGSITINDSTLNDAIDNNIYSDKEVYTQGTRSFIVWHHGNREERDTLEFFLDDDKKKQIFFRNSPKRFLARTRMIEDSKIDACISHMKTVQGLESILDEDITVKHNRSGDKAYVQLKCREKQLYLLPEIYFRVLAYNSEYFTTEKKALELYEKIKFTEGFRTHADQLKIVESIDEERKKIFYVKATCDANKDFNDKLKSLGMHQKITEDYSGRKKHVRSARQEMWDPLLLNNYTQQLRDFFPIHMSYNPDLPLSSQSNILIYPFIIKAVDLNKHQNDLGSAVRDATSFYLNNTCAIDLEIIDFNVGKQDISGRIYMAVLNSLSENKIYMTKEVWHSDIFRDSLLNKYGSDVQLVFAEDELDLVAKLSADSSRYYNIIGHNFKDFDHEHLVKFNYEHNLFKKGEIDSVFKEHIRSLRKDLGKSRLWSHTTNQVLDTYQYVKHRVDLFADHKLSTFAGFDKSLNYTQMHDLVKSGELNNLELLIDYTLEDGDKTWILNKQLLENAILESLATNKSLSSVFSSDPVKNFYDAGKRNYFMKLHTFRDRHSMSPRRHLEKFDNRMYNHEILLELMKDMPQKFGQISGELYYPSIFIDSFIDIIFANPVLQYIYLNMKNERNVLVKSDLLWKLSASLVVPVDKIKNYMEASGNTFGQFVQPSEVYKSLSIDSSDIEEVMNTYYGTDDFELSRTSFIFKVEYASRGSSITLGNIPLDTTIIEYNNLFAERLKRFKETGFLGRSQKYFIGDDSVGYDLGTVRAINLDDERFIGRLSDKNLYQSIRKPKNPLISGLVQEWLDDNTIDRDDAVRKVLSMPYDDQINPINRQIVRAILGFDPLRSKGNLQLF